MFARFANRWRDHDELDRGLACARDDYLFPALDGSDEFGQIGLRVMNVHFHEDYVS